MQRKYYVTVLEKKSEKSETEKNCTRKKHRNTVVLNKRKKFTFYVECHLLNVSTHGSYEYSNSRVNFFGDMLRIPLSRMRYSGGWG